MLNVLVLAGGLTAYFVFVSVFRLICKDKIVLNQRLKVFSLTEEHQDKQKRKRKRRSLPKIPRSRLVKLEDELYAASIMLRADEFIVIWLCLCILIPCLMLFLGANIIAYLAMLIICATGPIATVKIIKKKRLDKLDGQLVDALSIMCGALRAGFSFQKAMETISQEMPDPIAREFGRVSRECMLGMPMDFSFSRLIDRTRNKDLELICSAVLIQRQVGGNLAEVLDNVADTIRQRIKMKGDIKVLTASGTISGYIIGLLPVFLLLILMLLNPDYVNMFFTTNMGRIMLLVAGLLELIGFYFVKKVVSIKV